MPLDAETAHFKSFKSSAFYPPVIYLPQSMGLWLARQLGGGPVALLYAGRFANLLVFALLVAWAIRVAPFHRWAFCLLGALPMNLYHAASLNPDAMTFSLHLLLWVFILQVGWGQPKARYQAIKLSIALAFFLGASKGYWFLLIPCFFIPYPAEATIRKGVWLCGMIGLYLAAAVLWGYLNRNLIQFNHPDVAPLQQIRHILSHPESFAGAFCRACKIEYAVHYVRSAFGMLAWIHIHLPYWLLMSYLSLLIYFSLIDGPINGGISISMRLTLLGAALLGIIAVFVWLYCSYNPVGSPDLRGVQGRYFIPLVPLLLLTFTPCAKERSRPIVGRAILAASVLTITGIVTLNALICRFYDFW
jgi:uncharacterized membrane protein